MMTCGYKGIILAWVALVIITASVFGFIGFHEGWKTGWNDAIELRDSLK